MQKRKIMQDEDKRNKEESSDEEFSRKISIRPVEGVLEDMGIKWWYGTDEEVERTLNKLDALFRK